jgi:hypothetical protein
MPTPPGEVQDRIAVIRDIDLRTSALTSYDLLTLIYKGGAVRV